MDKKFNVTVNYKWCKACGICIELCPKNVLKADSEEKAIVDNMDACTGCESCVIHCPDFAIDVKEV